MASLHSPDMPNACVDALPLPSGAETWSRPLLGAFKKGMRAHQAGLCLSDCPYEDKRKWDGRLSWSRAFRNAWGDGWRWSEIRDKQMALF